MNVDTCLHRFIAAIKDSGKFLKDYPFPDGQSLVQETEEFFDAPLYVLSEEQHRTIMDRFIDKKVIGEFSAQLEELRQLGLLHLPHRRMVVEHRITVDDKETVRMMSLITVVTELEDGLFDIRAYHYLPYRDCEISMAIWTSQMKCTDEGIKLTLGSDKYSTEIAFLTYFLFIFLHTRGVVRDEVPEPVKLNKKRAQVGKPKIPAFTVVRVGFVTTKNGDTINVKEGDGTFKRMHVRRGHIREQRVGAGRLQTKRIYIRDCIVNFDPLIEQKALPRVVKT